MGLARAVKKILEEMKDQDEKVGKGVALGSMHKDGNPRRVTWKTLTDFANELNIAVLAAMEEPGWQQVGQWRAEIEVPEKKVHE